MLLTLERQWYTIHSTCGLLGLDGVFECYTLELPVKDGKEGSAIPTGTYEVKILPSERFKRPMPHLLNVPDREGILIHFGNYPRDTEGCILVGKSHELDFVGNSLEAFRDLFAKLEKADEISIRISGGPGVAIDPELGL